MSSGRCIWVKCLNSHFFISFQLYLFVITLSLRILLSVLQTLKDLNILAVSCQLYDCLLGLGSLAVNHSTSLCLAFAVHGVNFGNLGSFEHLLNRFLNLALGCFKNR